MKAKSRSPYATKRKLLAVRRSKKPQLVPGAVPGFGGGGSWAAGRGLATLVVKIALFPFEVCERIRLDWFRPRLVVGSVIALVLMSQANAWAGTLTIPVRRKTVCEELGYTDAKCTPKYESKRFIVGILTLISQIDTSEPDAPMMWSGIYANTVMISDSLGKVITSRTYQVNSGLNTYALLEGLRDPPCVMSGCLERRRVNPEYYGPTEEDIAFRQEVILNALFWQEADPVLASDLKAYAGARGMPLVTLALLQKVVDRTMSPAASSAQYKVVIQFALHK